LFENMTDEKCEVFTERQYEFVRKICNKEKKVGRLKVLSEVEKIIKEKMNVHIYKGKAVISKIGLLGKIQALKKEGVRK